MFSGTQIVCWPVDYVARTGLSHSQNFFKAANSSDCRGFRLPPQVWNAFAANTHTCSKSTLGSRRVFHWVTQTFLWITHGCSWANCARHTPVATLQPLADGSRPQKQLNPGEARVVVASGVCQIHASIQTKYEENIDQFFNMFKRAFQD